MWHSRLSVLEADVQDLEKPAETLVLMERLVEVQQLYSQLSKQAEQRTTLISKVGAPCDPSETVLVLHCIKNPVLLRF